MLTIREVSIGVLNGLPTRAFDRYTVHFKFKGTQQTHLLLLTSNT